MGQLLAVRGSSQLTYITGGAFTGNAGGFGGSAEPFSMGLTAAGTGASAWQSALGSYNDRWTGLTLQSSYSFSRSDAEDERSSRRSYFQQGSSPGHYMQDQTSQAVTRSHTLNLRADISLDSSNSLLASGSMSHTSRHSRSELSSASFWACSARSWRARSRVVSCPMAITPSTSPDAPWMQEVETAMWASPPDRIRSRVSKLVTGSPASPRPSCCAVSSNP